MKTKTARTSAALILAGSMIALPVSAQSVDWTQILGAILGGQTNQQASPGGNVGVCGSASGQSQTCNIPAGYRAEFVRQVSQAPCINGRTMYINPTNVMVTQGCRAEFRLVAQNNYPDNGYPANNGGNGQSGLPSALEVGLENALRDRMKAPAGEYSSLYDLSIVNARTTALRGGASAVNGNVNSVWGGRTYPAEFSANVDSGGRVVSVDYRYNNPNANPGPSVPGANWSRGTAMTPSIRAALERAIEADLRRQSGVTAVQVETNTVYQQQRGAKNEYFVRGKYGVSVNDGNWQTHAFEARIRTGSTVVNGLKTGLNP